MEKACAIIVCHEETEGWKLLLEPLSRWVEKACITAGITHITCCSQQNFLDGSWELATQDSEEILLVHANRPLLTAEEIVESLAQHQREGNGITHLEDGTGQVTGTAWCRKETLNRPPKQEGHYTPAQYQAITTRRQLSETGQALRQEILDRHLDNGVDIPLFDGIIIAPWVVIGKNSTILPGTILRGDTTIGSHCEIGPNSEITDSVIGDHTAIVSSYINQSHVGEQVKIGPMSNLRPGCQIHAGVKIGDFVELKNAEVGENTSISHLSYLGDCTIGSGCNFGCNTITVNYDGVNKHRTTIGNNAFIGCDCSLVAPLTLGDSVYAAAGSTITEDVPAESLVIARARQTVKPNWNKEQQRFHKK